MDKEFESELNSAIKKNELLCTFVKESEASDLLNMISKKFGLDFNKLFLWEMDRVELISSYENDWNDCLRQLTAAIEEFDDNLFVIITEDEKYPFIVLKIKKNHLVILLSDTRVFEYFIVDKDLKQVVFDTHHNEFLRLLPLS